jgi:hypothetical protein
MYIITCRTQLLHQIINAPTATNTWMEALHIYYLVIIQIIIINEPRWTQREMKTASPGKIMNTKILMGNFGMFHTNVRYVKIMFESPTQECHLFAIVSHPANSTICSEADQHTLTGIVLPITSKNAPKYINLICTVWP